MKLYMCRKCGTVIETASGPSGSSCPQGGNHIWNLLTNDGSTVAKPGLIPFMCKKCGTLVYAKQRPNATQCPSGGGHVWNRV
ncbi:hypothetical protein [Desulfurobacterium atlanticum]|uniref:Uncharacterized protein n=1 Tax=Desulfurobacterium atlanticum TaxID=240169 RepID=A0A239A740_9BACT|nr:hypothetical protein [Desulfurobacterium atlanticum]SNR90703.1 hypothetical protein SAMN06265340_11531 [Desulfurobacterium atlanticum]